MDELNVSVFPVVLGRGTPMFQPGSGPKSLELASVEQSSTGVVSLTYTRT